MRSICRRACCRQLGKRIPIGVRGIRSTTHRVTTTTAVFGPLFAHSTLLRSLLPDGNNWPWKSFRCLLNWFSQQGKRQFRLASMNGSAQKTASRAARTGKAGLPQCICMRPNVSARSEPRFLMRCGSFSGKSSHASCCQSHHSQCGRQAQRWSVRLGSA